jgi:hypothetical protein
VESATLARNVSTATLVSPYTSLVFSGGCKVSALIDSGASRSLLRRDFFLFICKTLTCVPILSRTLPLVSVSKTPLQVLGEAEVQLFESISWPWVIVDNIPYEAILGADLLKQVGAELNFSSETLTLAKVPYPIAFNDNIANHITSIVSPLETLLDSFADVFHVPGEPVKPCLLSPLVIDTGSSFPVHQRPYRTPLAKRPLVEAEISEILKLGFIRPSSLPYAAPLLLFPKKDSTRFQTAQSSNQNGPTPPTPHSRHF